MESPYRPGFGVPPAVLVGRDAVLARAAADLTRVANSGHAAPSVTVFIGVRGLGKTVTLEAIAAESARRGFVCCSIALDSVSDNVQLVASRVAEAVAPLESRVGGVWEALKHRLESLSVELNAGVVKITSDAPAAASSGTVARQALGDVLAKAALLAAEHDRRGLVVLIDEFQEAPHAQLVVLCNAIQDALTSPPAPPMIFFAAGLPNTPDKVMAAASFTERFDFRVLDRLGRDDAERALVEPCLPLGVSWAEGAARDVLDAAAGSPYLIQKLGDEAWYAASPDLGGTISRAAVAEAVTQVRAGLDVGMYRGRWAKATPAERALLAAMAQVADAEGAALTGEITRVTGRTTPQLSSIRKALIDKGIIETAGKGRWRFTMPGFADFVLSQADPDDRPDQAHGWPSPVAGAPRGTRARAEAPDRTPPHAGPSI